MPVILCPYGDRGILLSWPQLINEEIAKEIFVLDHKIKAQMQDCVIETVTTYCSLMVYTRHSQDLKSIIVRLRELLIDKQDAQSVIANHWKIPVCYHESLAPDLRNLALQKKLTVNEVIELHCSPIYTVNFIGFLPGFPYLSGLNPQLHTRRLTSPRTHVAKGSVAIGGQQTGVYPLESPGGWHIVGRTPIEFFNSHKTPPCFLKPMDTLEFYPVSLEEFDNVR